MRRLLIGLCAFVISLITSAHAQGKQAGGGIQPMCVSGCQATVSVTPDGGTVEVLANSGSHTVTFFVTNTSSTSGSYSLTCSSVKVTCGTVTPSSVTLAANGTIDVDVSFTVGSLAGSVTLTASGSATDTGSYSVVLVSPVAPSVSLRNQNGDNLDRGLCLISGAGEAAAMQCGDLLVAHGTPGYSTMGRERSLTLLYSSAQAVPRPLVAVAVTQPSGSATPATVLAELKVNSGIGYVTVASASYTGWGAGTQPSRQIALAYTDTTSQSGLYPFQLTVTNQYPGAYATTVSGTLILVNRAGSRFGRGWSLAGVEELKFNQPVGTSTGDILWVGGDGSAKRYTKLNPTTWVAPLGAFRDTLVLDNAAQTYTRTLRHGVQVVFDIQGHQISTVNRTLQSTTFYWNGTGQLTSIRVPPKIGTGVTYTIAYLANGDFDRITDPAGRVTDGTVTSSRLTSLVDPDTTIATQFGYDGAGRLTTRTNRRGFVTRYSFANTTRLTSVIAPGTLATGDTIVFQPWDEQGLATGSTGQAAVDTASAFTRILGPRVGVPDNASIWVDRWGAPTRITNALNQTTTLTRADPLNPSLITRDSLPDGRIAMMSYNSRGNLIAMRDSSLYLPNGLPTAVSQWYYDSPNTKDAPSLLLNPENVSTQFQYNNWGLTSLTIASNSHVTSFEYTPAGSADSLYGLLRAVIDSNVPAFDSATGTEQNRSPRVAFGFNQLGNIVADTSALGRVRAVLRDSRQLVTDAYDGAGFHVDFLYNQFNFVLRSSVHVEQAGRSSLYPADSGATAPLVTMRYYTLGLLDSIADPRGVKLRFGYDGAGRLVSETDALNEIQRTWYNAASLVDSIRYRTGGKVRYTYDAGGRLMKSAWDARQAPADSTLYTYDSGNRLITALLGSGRSITRTYFANGAPKTEVQGGPQLFRHAYTYDRAGKRTTYVVGKPADITSNDSMSYRYDSSTGLLQRIYVRWRRPNGLNDPIPADSVRFAWDALGRRDTVAFTNGATIRFAYDQDGALRVLCSIHGGTMAGDSLKFSFHTTWIDEGGRVRRLDRVGHSLCPTDGVGGTDASYAYDVRGQMLQDYPDGPYRWNFRYDESGNMIRRERLDQTDLNVFTIATGTNRLTRYDRNGQLRVAIAYDSDGARTSECSQLQGSSCVVSPGYREYHYDGLARMVGSIEYTCTSFDPSSWTCGTYGSQGSVTCAYDPIGRLAQACGAYGLGYDGQSVSRTVTDSTWGWTFVHGPGTDDPLLGYSTAGGGSHAYFITDGDGRLFAVTEPDGTSLQAGGGAPDSHQQAYQTWDGENNGGIQSSLGFGADRFRTAAQPGLSFFRNRVYDQSTGRWTQEDPIGVAGGVNLYQFNGNNPASYTDPFGLSPCSDLRGEIDELVTEIQGYIARYMGYFEKGDADSGHWKAIKQKQRLLQKKQRTYKQMKCDKDDDHDDWNGLGPALQVQKQPIPGWQVDRSHGRYRPSQMSLPIVTPPTPGEVNAIGALGSVLILARYAWLVLLP